MPAAFHNILFSASFVGFLLTMWQLDLFGVPQQHIKGFEASVILACSLLYRKRSCASLPLKKTFTLRVSRYQGRLLGI